MNDREKITELLIEHLQARDDVYAFWIEGSEPQGYADEFSGIDLGLSVDDDKIFTIYDARASEIERVLPELETWIKSL